MKRPSASEGANGLSGGRIWTDCLVIAGPLSTIKRPVDPSLKIDQNVQTQLDMGNSGHLFEPFGNSPVRGQCLIGLNGIRSFKIRF